MESKAPKFPFTTLAEIESWEDDEDMATYIGYVTKWSGTEKAKNNVPIARLLLSNNFGTVIQVQAWGPKNIKKLETVASLDNVVKVDGAKLLTPIKKSIFNEGNVNRELRVEFQTKIELLGVFNEEKRRESATKVTLATISDHQGLVAIEGKVLIPIRKVRSINEKEYGCGAIVGNGYKLELRVLEMPEKSLTELNIGQTILAEGKLIKRSIPRTTTPAPAYFEVDKLSNIKVTNKKSDITVEELTKNYNYIYAKKV